MMDYYDISIGQYLEIQEILEVEDVPELDKITSLIAVCKNVDEDTVLDYDIQTFNKCVNEISFLFSPYPKEVMKEYYVLNGREYEVSVNLQKLTAGQYIDYQTFIKEPIKNLVELLSVFVIPKGKKYGDYDMEAVHKDIREYMSIVDGLAISGFFLLVSQSLIQSTLTYLKKKLKKMRKKERNREIVEKYEQAIRNLENVGDISHL